MKNAPAWIIQAANNFGINIIDVELFFDDLVRLQISAYERGLRDATKGKVACNTWCGAKACKRAMGHSGAHYFAPMGDVLREMK